MQSSLHEPNLVILKLVEAIIPSHVDTTPICEYNLVLSSFKYELQKNPKYNTLYNHVLNNFFLSNEKKAKCLKYFVDIQRKYIYLLTFSRIVKLKL